MTSRLCLSQLGFRYHQRTRNPKGGDDSGFTLIELLVAVTILPLIMGAIAAAVMVTLDNQTTISNRLVDSSNGQLSASYFGRDTAGAGYITQIAPSAPYSYTSPQVCPATNPGTLIVGLYHEQSASSNPFDIGYWLVNSQIVRYSCSLDTTNYTATSPQQVILADHVSSESLTVQPPQFSKTVAHNGTFSGALYGWTQTVATTYVQSVTPATTLNVLSTAGFTDGTLTVATPLGNRLLTACAVGSATAFTGCNTSATPVYDNEAVSQDSLQALNIVVSQSPVNQVTGTPSVEYRYSITGAPRTQTPWGAGPGVTPIGGNPGGPSNPGGPGGSGSGPALLVLGNQGVGLTGTTNLSVTGSAQLDGGTASCSGSSSFTATGGINAYNTNSSGCSLTPGPYVKDPIAAYLPSCFPVQPAGATKQITLPNGTTATAYTPGRYRTTILPNNSHGIFYLEPGVYEFDAGLSIGSNQTIELDPTAQLDANGQKEGILLYAPGAAPANPVTGCAYGSASSINLGAQGAEILPPLTAAQSAAAFAGNSSLAGMWIWQDATNTSNADLGGGSTVSGTTGYSAGLAYLPTAIVTLHGGPGAGTGRIICAGLNLVGNSTVTVTGP